MNSPTEEVVAKRRRGYPPLPEAEYNAKWMKRILSSVKQDASGCWIWQRSKNYKGYGYTNYRGTNTAVHRRVYMIIFGVTLKEEEYVCHSCDVKACCNPLHLWIGDNRANQLDASDKGVHGCGKKTHCKFGHPYDAENTYVATKPNGRTSRHCRQCQRDKGKRLWRDQRDRTIQRQRAYKARKLQEQANG